MVKLPVIPGHEIGAIVEEVTEGVPDIIKRGMFCTVNPYTYCGYCSSCRNGRSNVCRYNQTLGVQRDGAMCEYLVVPWEKIIADDGLTYVHWLGGTHERGVSCRIEGGSHRYRYRDGYRLRHGWHGSGCPVGHPGSACDSR